MWLLIDGNNWFARDYFAAGDGRAIERFLNRLRDVREDRRPDRVAVCWDSRSFRHQLDPNYKAGRGEKPPGFNLTLSDLRDAVAGVDVTSIAVPGFEADDLLAALAANAIDEGEKATICSSDRDLHQCLVDGRINQYTRVHRDTAKQLSYDFVTAQTLKRDHGVHPHQWVDFRAMTGDTSDGIKGCVGIGPKVAVEVLCRFDSLDQFFAEPFKPQMTARQRALLLAFKDSLPHVRQLLRLRHDAPLPASWLEAIPI